MSIAPAAGVFYFLILSIPFFGLETAEKISQARKLLEVREYLKAETVVREALSSAPGNAEARCVLGLSLLGQNKFKDSETVVRNVLNAAPEDVEANYVLGLSLLGQEKLKEAEQAILKADKAMPEIDPKYPDDARRARAGAIRIGLARVYMEQNQLDKAGDALSRAEKIQPKDPDLYYYRGILDAHRKDYAAVARDMDKTIELDPKRAEAYYYAGIAYNQIKKPDRMVERFQLFLKIAPDAPEAAKVRALLRSIR
jgi:tetratricopeptide (TPR) repeat protein